MQNKCHFRNPYINAVTKIPTNLIDDDLVEFIPMTNVNEGLGNIKQFNFVPLKEVSSGYTKFRNGDVIFAKITPCMENGNCAIVHGLTYGISFGSTEFMVFRPLRKLTEKYLHYFLHNEFFRKNAEPFMKGTAGQKRISSHYMATHYFALPPLPEQKAIADYLDTKTAHIDRKIDLLTQKATQYGKLKQSLINEIVTRGLDKSVAMKDSGVEWIGEVPEHWKINFLVKVLSSLVDYRGRTPKKVSPDENGMFLVTARNIKKGCIDYSLSEEFVDIDDVQSLLNRGKPKIGDVLFTTEAPLGEVANVDREDFALAQRIIKFRGEKNSLNNYFMKYWLISSVFQNTLQRNATGSTALGLKGSKVRLLNIIIPPLPEQQVIVDYLDTKTTHINRIIETINTQIDKLKELRKTLINDVVTGKIKVV